MIKKRLVIGLTTPKLSVTWLTLLALSVLLQSVSQSTLAQTEFTPETMGIVETLPKHYPDHWLLVHDAAFFHMLEGKLLLVDPLGRNAGSQLKGTMSASLIAQYQYSARRQEHYIIETFYSRGARGGEKTEVVSIYDSENLAVQGEVIIPAKRVSGMPKTTATALIDNERLLLVYNFTPAQSVSVIDLAKRVLVTEIPTPGCSFVIPTARRSFTSICANGSLLTTHLDRAGKAAGKTQIAALFDAEADPIFEAPARANDIAYFPTFKGRVLPIDMRKKEVSAGEPFWLTSNSERNWRPGGMRPTVVDSNNLGYFLMHPEGADGTHKDGGSEVWVFDLAKGKRLARLPLKNWGISISTTGSGEGRLLAVTNTDMQVDVYHLPTGDYHQTLAITAETPFVVYGMGGVQ